MRAAGIILLLLLPLPLQAQEIGKSIWIERISSAFPKVFCAEQQYFRQCFAVSARQCKKTVASAIRSCMNRYKADMPARFGVGDGRHWGRTIGACVGRRYEIVLIEQRIDSAAMAECGHPRHSAR